MKFVILAILVGVFLAGGVSSSSKKPNGNPSPQFITDGRKLNLFSTFEFDLQFFCQHEASNRSLSEKRKFLSMFLKDTMTITTCIVYLQRRQFCSVVSLAS